MKNGIYALASLDGRPLAPRDRAVLGLDGAHVAGLRSAPGCCLLAQDVRASAVHARAGPHGIDALLGDLDEPADAARVLGLPIDSDPLTVVLRTVERFGDGAPARLLGSWVLVRWDAAAATMTLLMAERVRDSCYVATDGRRVAISPELVRLARLDWIDATPDPAALLLGVGRLQLRRALGNRTILRDVIRVMPATRTTVRAGDLRIAAATPLPVPTTALPVRFEEAIEQLDHLLRRIARQHVAREGDSALSLSGGLDSTLVALYAAQERGSRSLTLLTSAAPPGSGIADESGFAATVAAHLGLPIDKVSPAATANIYRPSERMFAAAEIPLPSVRHYMDEALEQAASARGARALLNGYGGEMAVTNSMALSSAYRPLRYAARLVRDAWRNGRDQPAPDWFHVKLSPAALDRAPLDVAALWHDHALPDHRPAGADPIGVGVHWSMVADFPGWETTPDLREVSPFFDRRLVRYATALPAAFMRRHGRDRALGRELLRGKVPDSIAFRRSGMAYSPTYVSLLREQAATARRRLSVLAAGQAGEWIDVPWLDDMLLRIEQETLPIGLQFKVQLSCVFAEFFPWWEGHVGRPSLL